MEWQYPHVVISLVCGQLTFTLSWKEGFVSLLHLHLTCNCSADTISHVLVVHRIWKFAVWWDESKCCGDHNNDRTAFATSCRLKIAGRGAEFVHRCFGEAWHRPPRSSIRSTSEHYAPRCCKLNCWKRFMKTKEELFTASAGSGVIKGAECCSKSFVIFKVLCTVSHSGAFVAQPGKCNHWWSRDWTGRGFENCGI